jgi:GDP-D-mannose dehydratase
MAKMKTTITTGITGQDGVYLAELSGLAKEVFRLEIKMICYAKPEL